MHGFREELGADFTFLSDANRELLERLNIRHYRHKGDVAFPTAILVDRYGIIRWIYEADLRHVRMTPPDLLAAMEKLALEEQNRELLRGRAVSQVVRQVFLMEKPDDLGRAIDVMRRELKRLGLDLSVCGIAIVSAEGRSAKILVARESRSSGELDIVELPDDADLFALWTRASTESVVACRASGLSCEGTTLPLDLTYIVNVPFSHGAVFIGYKGDKKPPEDDARTLKEFADAISVAYQRFEDFQTLERQTRELRETQVQLIQSEKMAALGQLVAGVAHELNTPVGAILSNTQSERGAFGRLQKMLEKGSGDGPSMSESESELRTLFAQVAEMNRLTETASRRIMGIVSNLKKFARLDESEWKEADLREGLDETLALVEHQTRGRITIVREYEDVPLAGCYPGQLNQVFMNLIVNAIQAIEDRGTIRVACLWRGNAVVVRISDDGSGIAPEALPRIFDPGFTTKGVGVGTGLGLSISYRIVESHGGRLEVESEPGRGTTFEVHIPLRAKRPVEVSPAFVARSRASVLPS